MWEPVYDGYHLSGTVTQFSSWCRSSKYNLIHFDKWCTLNVIYFPYQISGIHYKYLKKWGLFFFFVRSSRYFTAFSSAQEKKTRETNSVRLDSNKSPVNTRSKSTPLKVQNDLYVTDHIREAQSIPKSNYSFCIRGMNRERKRAE